jgi:hypothetical protein
MMETLADNSNQAITMPQQVVHEITSSYEYRGCCPCCCCIDREKTILSQGIFFITRFFGCCGCNGREEHIIKTQHVEKVSVLVPNSGECLWYGTLGLGRYCRVLDLF